MGKNKLLVGCYFRQIDKKNRILIPSKLKNGLEKSVFLTINLDNKGEIYSHQDFLNFQNNLLNNNDLDINVRNYKRFILANTIDLEIDSVGRILLPNELIKKLEIKNEVVFIGLGNKIEIWAKELYEKYLKEEQTIERIKSLNTKLLKGGVKI